MGAAAVEAAHRAVAGESVEAEISVPVTIVTSANVDEFRAIFE
jgi:ribose transport system substrate-binding protein